MKPVVSVIMPVYNAGNYLAPAIESVLNQTYQNFELILVNDGATDGSGEICEQFARKNERVKLFVQKNKGISSARNLGIEHAQGEYIAFCDHDDICRADCLKDAVNAIQNFQTDIVKFEYITEWWNTPQSCTFKSHNALPEKALNIKFLLQNYYLFDCCIRAIWNGIYSKSAIQTCNIKFDETARYGMEDYLFNIELLNAVHSVGFISNCLYTHYNRSWQSTDCKYSLNKVNSVILSAQYEKNLYEKKGLFTTQRYIERLTVYLDKIISEQLLHKECDLSFKEKVAVIKKTRKQEGFRLPKEIPLRQINLKKYIKLVLYRYDFIEVLLVVYKLKALKNKIL